MDLAAIVPHLSRPESMRGLLDANVRGNLFQERELGEMVEYAIDWWLRSSRDGGASPVPPAQLEDRFPAWFARRTVPEGDYILSEIIDELRQKRMRQGVQSVIKDVMAPLVMDDPEEAVREGIQELVSLRAETLGSRERVPYGQTFAERNDAYIERALEASVAGHTPGCPIGWPEVTRDLFGLHAGEVCVVVGWTGLGKSWCMCKFALEAAREGKRVYFASLENALDLTLGRIDCIAAGIPFEQYERATLGLEQLRRLDEARERIEAIGDLLMVDRPRRRDRTIAEIYTRAAHHGADLVVGDQLRWVQAPIRQSERRYEMEDKIAEIADVSKDLSVASVWAHQFNRKAGGAKKGRGDIEDLADSSWIEQTADFVMRLSQSSEQRAERQMILELLKSRRTRRYGWVLDWVLDGETRMEIARPYGGSE